MPAYAQLCTLPGTRMCKKDSQRLCNLLHQSSCTIFYGQMFVNNQVADSDIGEQGTVNCKKNISTFLLQDLIPST